MKIKDRIRKHYRPGIDYHELMRLVFPEKDYPRAFEYQSHGGPPGCAMAFGKALREMGGRRDTVINYNVITLPEEVSE